MRERLRGVDVEARAAAGRVGVDDEETVLVGERRVLSALEVLGRGACALMNGDDEREGARKLGRLVHEHPDIVRVRANVGGDLLQLVLSSAGGERTEECDENRGKTHFE